MSIRKVMFADSWYPGSAKECEKEIEFFLKEKNNVTGDFIGGIVPHAGWYFSGSTACNVIHFLKDKTPPEVITVFGMHLAPNSPCYIMKKGAWETPFGEIQIEEDFTSRLMDKFGFIIDSPEVFAQDNTIELQLPFIKYFFNDVKIVPIGVPPAEIAVETGRYVAEISKKSQLNVKVLGSTDLTHYGYNYDFTPKGTGKDSVDWAKNENDRKIIDLMLKMDADKVIAEALLHKNACCSGAAAASIAAASALGADNAGLVKYASSYDKSPNESFVGYAGILFNKT